MGRPSNEEKRRRARESLIQTIAKINDLEPILGGKWRAHMLDYYISRMAELVLYQSGFRNPSKTAMASVEANVRVLLLCETD